jgi:hypothetical protein
LDEGRVGGCRGWHATWGLDQPGHG